MTPDQLRRAMANFSLINDVDLLRRGHIRIETHLKYPDGTSIDVFLVDPGRNGNFTLSDLGQTTSWLMTSQVKPWLSKKRQSIVEDILRVSNVIQNGGALQIIANNQNEIAMAVLRLAQCCSRVADLTFTKRVSNQNPIREEVEEMISDFELPYESDFEIFLPRRNVKVDFLVRSPRLTSAILTLSSSNSQSAHTISNEIFTRWFDLEQNHRTEQRVTIFDDRRDVYRDDDLDRLSTISTLVPMSDRQGLQTIIAA